MHAWPPWDDHRYLQWGLDSYSYREQDHQSQLHVFQYDEMEECRQQRDLPRDGHSLIRLEG